MNRLPKILCLAGLAATLAAGGSQVLAQDGGQDGGRRNRQGGPGGPGGFDPEQMRQRMAERMREQFEVKDDEEWKLISARIEKVTEARRNTANRGAMGMMFGGRRGQGGPGGGGPGGGGRGGFGGEPSPEAEALQKAIESNAPAAQIKAALGKYRASMEANEAKLAKAQDELREVLTVKQEATAVLMGLLK